MHPLKILIGDAVSNKPAKFSIASRRVVAEVRFAIRHFAARDPRVHEGFPERQQNAAYEKYEAQMCENITLLSVESAPLGPGNCLNFGHACENFRSAHDFTGGRDDRTNAGVADSDKRFVIFDSAHHCHRKYLVRP